MSCPIIERLDALHAKSTPGEWASDIRTIGVLNPTGAEYKFGRVVTCGCCPDSECQEGNTDLIVALHNAWPVVSAVLKAADAHEAAYARPGVFSYDEVCDAEAALYKALCALRACKVDA